VLLGTPWGTHWEHRGLIGNLKGTIGNKGKMKKNDTHPCFIGKKREENMMHTY
jgi:hypothetical protein